MPPIKKAINKENTPNDCRPSQIKFCNQIKYVITEFSHTDELLLADKSF